MSGSGAAPGRRREETSDDDETPPPVRCDRTLSFPRFALSDGKSLFIADGGNDRILVFNEVPTENAASPDVVIGQRDFETLLESDGAGSIRAPQALAHDGTNLYAADPFARRVLVFTPGEDQIGQDGLRNSASFAIRAFAFSKLDRSADEGQELTLTINETEYKIHGKRRGSGQRGSRQHHGADRQRSGRGSPGPAYDWRRESCQGPGQIQRPESPGRGRHRARRRPRVPSDRAGG